MPLVGRLLIQGKRLLIIIQPILITISYKSTEKSPPRQHVELCVYECKYRILQPPPPPQLFPAQINVSRVTTITPRGGPTDALATALPNPTPVPPLLFLRALRAGVREIIPSHPPRRRGIVRIKEAPLILQLVKNQEKSTKPTEAPCVEGEFATCAVIFALYREEGVYAVPKRKEKRGIVFTP